LLHQKQYADSTYSRLDREKRETGRSVEVCPSNDEKEVDAKDIRYTGEQKRTDNLPA
jgi:hypothetical protein